MSKHLSTMLIAIIITLTLFISEYLSTHIQKIIFILFISLLFGYFFTLRSISNIKASDKLDTLMNTNDDLLFFKDKDFNYIDCNKEFLKLVKKTKKEVIGNNDFELFSKEKATLFREMDIQMLKNNEISSNYEWLDYPDGRQAYLQAKKIPFYYNKMDVGVLGMTRDITKIKEELLQVEKKAYIDGLTQIYNRNKFDEIFGEELKSAQRYKHVFTVAILDIDKFKNFNDIHGHLVGDEVLITMAQTLNKAVRETDTFARWGGEEFIILFKSTNLIAAKEVSEKLRKKIEKNEHPTAGKITASFGLTEYKNGDTYKSIFKRCDEALYMAKANGRNRVEVF